MLFKTYKSATQRKLNRSNLAWKNNYQHPHIQPFFEPRFAFFYAAERPDQSPALSAVLLCYLTHFTKKIFGNITHSYLFTTLVKLRKKSHFCGKNR
jgi:hypothetical protein